MEASGKKVRTLPTGEKVHEHPDGSLHLIHDHSMRRKLDAREAEHKELHAALFDQHLERVERKRADQQAKGLPSEKSPI